MNTKRFLWLLILLISCSSEGFAQYGLPTQHSLLDRANHLYENGRYAESRDLYEQALTEDGFEVGSERWTIARLGLGASLLDLQENKRGINLLFETNSLAGKELPLELQAYTKKQLAWAFGRNGQPVKRWETYELAYELALQSENAFRIADLQVNMADISFDRGEYKNALEYARASSDYFRSQDSDFFKIMSLSRLSVAYKNLGYLEKAAGPILEVIKIGEASNNTSLLLYNYNRAGGLFKEAGKYDLSLLFFNKAFNLAELSGSFLSMSGITNDIGAVYSFMSDYENALLYYKRSLEYRKKGRLPVNYLTIYNVGLIQYDNRDLKAAERSFYDVLDHTNDPEDAWLRTKTYINLAPLLLKMDDASKALDYAKKAVERSEKTNDIILQISSYKQLAYIYEALSDYKSSVNYYRKANKLSASGRGWEHSRNIMQFARAFREVNADSAYFYADKAFEEIERIRNNIYGDDLQSENFRRYAGFYEQVAGWHLSDFGDVETAFRLIEQGKSRTLLDYLSSTPLELLLDEATSLKLREEAKLIDQKYRQLEGVTDEQVRKEIRAEIQDLELSYQTRLNEARLKNPEMKKFSLPEMMSISGLQNTLDTESAVIQYSVNGDQLIAIWVTSQETGYYLQRFPNTDSSESLSSYVSRFRESIQEMRSVEELQKASVPIYESLIAPFEELQPEVSRLLIIPDGTLSYLPFEALMNEDGKYLIEKFLVKYLPSASTLNYIAEPRHNNEQELLAVAGSGFESGDIYNESRSLENYASLPATLMEVDSIASHFSRAVLLKNEEVSEATVKSLNLGQFKYLHFATHGTFNTDNPGQSGLLLSHMDVSNVGTEGEDGLLNSGEISLLDLNADMVVLSACNTGYGRNIAGEGLLGLQRSFLKAGASSVVVSLWSVLDQSTSVLMSSFYRNLNTYEKEEFGFWNSSLRFFNLYETPLFDYKSKALRDAKLSLLSHPYYKHPVHWAPFIYIGK